MTDSPARSAQEQSFSKVYVKRAVRRALLFAFFFAVVAFAKRHRDFAGAVGIGWWPSNFWIGSVVGLAIGALTMIWDQMKAVSPGDPRELEFRNTSDLAIFLRYFTPFSITYAVAISMAYAAWTVLLPRWKPFLFYSYFIVGLICAIAHLLPALRGNKVRDFRTMLAVSMAEAMDERSIIRRSRLLATYVFFGLECIITWPALEVSRLVSNRRRTSRGSEYPAGYLGTQSIEPRLAIYVIGVILLLLILAKRYESDDTLVLSLTLLGSAVVLRHSRYLVDLDGLPAWLRRATGNPYSYFLLILSCDFASLTLSAAIFTRQTSLNALSLQDALHSARNLFGFHKLLGLLSGQPLTSAEVASSIAGFLFYLALFRTIHKLRDFRPSDADWSWGAAQNIQFGRFADALKALSKIKSPTADSLFLEAIAYLGVNQVQKAEERMRASISIGGTEATDEIVFSALVQHALVSPIPTHPLCAMIRRGIELRVSDACMRDNLTSLLYANDTIPPELVSILQEMESGGYPLSIARVYIATNQLSEAWKLLESLRPSSPIDELIRIVSMCEVTLLHFQDSEKELAARFSAWADENLRLIREVSNSLTKEMECVIAYGEILSLLDCAERWLPHRVQEICFLRDRMRARLTSSESGTKVLRLIDKRIEILQRR